MTTQYFTIDSCTNKSKKNFKDYYVYVNDDRLFHQSEDGLVGELFLKEKEDVLSSGLIMLSKENCVNSDSYTNLMSKKLEKFKMNAPIEKVKVVPKSNKYTIEDVETALNVAYDECGLVLDFIKETDNYMILYLKEKEI